MTAKRSGDEVTPTDGLKTPETPQFTAPITVESASYLRPRALGLEANLIVISHPDRQWLGKRFRLGPGSISTIGRARQVEVSLPDLLSVSRHHARLSYKGAYVLIEDLGSLNGTFVGDRAIEKATPLSSGDRIQVGEAYFKFLHEEDVENAFHEAIYQLAIRDGLTELHNRRRFDEALREEFVRARRHGRPLSLVLLDIDHFKDINDRHGHLAGDSVLKRLAQDLRQVEDPGQCAARVGGEEFALLCPETELEEARELAERLRARFAAQPSDFAGTAIELACSFGVAALRPEHVGASDLYDAADRALYRAKENGRNRVEVDSGDPPAPKN